MKKAKLKRRTGVSKRPSVEAQQFLKRMTAFSGVDGALLVLCGKGGHSHISCGAFNPETLDQALVEIAEKVNEGVS